MNIAVGVIGLTVIDLAVIKIWNNQLLGMVLAGQHGW